MFYNGKGGVSELVEKVYDRELQLVEEYEREKREEMRAV